MGASRKLQGEIDRVLKKVQEGVEVFDSIWKKVYDTDNANQKEKFEADLKKEIKKLQRYRDQIKTWIQSSEIKDKKVSASYEQALVDARKLIEREMERFKICEKETKTKAFSKEGLGQQPKTDPKEKAKSETRDWLNNVVSELETQIDIFEAEVEGLSVKKGKTKPLRLVHLETSITRHKAHIMKLELILRLLDNDELSSEQVNDVKELLEDYVERNQDDFDEFTDVDELYSSLPIDESLEELVTVSTPGLHKATITVVHKQDVLTHELANDASSQDGSFDVNEKSPPAKYNSAGSGSIFAGTHSIPITSNVVSPRNSVASAMGAVLPALSSPHGSVETSASPSSPSAMKLPSPSKEEHSANLSVRRPTTGDSGLTSEVEATVGETLGAIPASPDIGKRNMLATDDRLSSSGMIQPLMPPPSSRALLSHGTNVSGATSIVSSIGASENIASGSKTISSLTVSSMPWKPGSSLTQNEAGQFHGRVEVVPDIRERFMQRLQLMNQQGQANLLGMASLTGGIQKPLPSQHQNPLMQPINSPGSLTAPQGGLGLGLQKPSFNAATTVTLNMQPSSIHQMPSPQASASAFPRDSEFAFKKTEEPQMQKNTPDGLSGKSTSVFGMGKNTNEDDLKSPNSLDSPARASADHAVEQSAGQHSSSTQTSATFGVIGRRNMPDLGSVGEIPDSGSTTSSAGINDRSSSVGINNRSYNLKMLEAAYLKLPQPKDSERLRSYAPRNPAATPSSYPQVQAPMVNNPAFWERLGLKPYDADTLFFAFYHQPNTYQQYLAAKELKKQSWRYHKKYNTWFQRHEEPEITTDEYEQGIYVYFDFHVASEEPLHGWCQRVKTEFRFDYKYLEDEVMQ
ncbi:hypothetical protein SAY87_032353 [Trapa incisa]|uniref:CCR4-NOT transcription complex subunit 3 n=1 Tax=Trapa incisa TaxID=236973 RepID=A0AAN7GNQ0_9MYRT|nr:hypothetical protein SAY87_032353 [Trapa incisa]